MTALDDIPPGPYVALGDSISIDDYAGGPGRGGASLLARNRDGDFPAWAGADLGPRPWSVLATDGATTDTLLDRQLPALARLADPPAVVTVTIGGNDVLGSYGNTAAALRTVRTVGERLDDALGQIRASTRAGARLVVGTVYDPSDGTGDAPAVGLPPWPDVVSVLDELNTTLRAAARRHGALIADIHQHFGGHGLAAGNPASPDPRPDNRELWYCQVIEPNAWGAHGVRAAFWEALGGPLPSD
ncbi:SGNH/GDSL hydrolase family protein [Georgenia faecalis]|uniref:SGNH/GDSL hydrolase family protein n=1 Tax=Georgenia faecalis TaxID=2483799 RepID=A0ABV9DE00_9MICO|nr:GDSL-type esterase/lipase family protein [Georgenia faecalis]